MTGSRPGCPARGAPVVRAVMEAAIEELSRVGYGALTVEQVALRAGVNKTTVYRRWPTKPELIAAALSDIAAAAPPLEESGEIRRDLLAVTRRIASAMGSPRGRATLRMLLGGGADPDLVALASAARERFVAPARRVVDAAMRRGALRSTIPPDLLLEIISGWIVNALFRERVHVREGHLERLVALLLEGARESATAIDPASGGLPGARVTPAGQRPPDQRPPGQRPPPARTRADRARTGTRR